MASYAKIGIAVIIIALFALLTMPFMAAGQGAAPSPGTPGRYIPFGINSAGILDCVRLRGAA